MYRKSIAWISCSVLLCLSRAALADVPPREWTLVLFGAQWCAPCRTEIRELAALAEAARPARLRLAWIDRRPSGLPVPPAGGWSILDPAEARRLLETSAPAATGLPLAVLFDGDRACARWSGPVTIMDVARLKDSCRVHPVPVGRN